jgi:hypothetical protein
MVRRDEHRAASAAFRHRSRRQARRAHSVHARSSKRGSRQLIIPGDIRVKLRPRGDVAEFLFYAPFFEREQLRLVRALLRPRMRVLDVGANSGLYSIFANRFVGDEGHVWALEPSAETFSLLRSSGSTSKVW